ncbi:hypothetical protein SK128_022448, partial [Halocaridina rubra]
KSTNISSTKRSFGTGFDINQKKEGKSKRGERPKGRPLRRRVEVVIYTAEGRKNKGHQNRFLKTLDT